MSSGTEDVLVRQSGRLGVLTLNRPKALNALSLPMIRTLSEALAAFEAAEDIDAIVIEGAGERAFCAGGDVRAIANADPTEADAVRRAFFAGEYTLNYRIHTARKPVIALMDGITMGGGCGLSLHTRFRVSTERTLLAMPETVLGLFPDVGATWFLNQLPGRMGLYLGLTGVRLKANDLVALGMATHAVAAERLEELTTALSRRERLDEAAIAEVLAGFAVDPGGSEAAGRRPEVDRLFSGDTVAEIRRDLGAAPEPWAVEAAAVIDRASPTSLCVTHRQLSRGRGLPLEEMFRIEYRLAVRITAGHDFREGVRAILIDKDNQPRWRPARLDEIDPAAIDALFAPFPSPEMELPL